MPVKGSISKRVKQQRKIFFMKAIFFVVLPFFVFVNLILVICLWKSLSRASPVQFKVTPQQVNEYITVQSYRQALIFENTVEDNILERSFPIVYRKGSDDSHTESGFYGVRGNAKYMGPSRKGDEYSKDGYNGPVFLHFGRSDSALLDLNLAKPGFEHIAYDVINIRDYVEYGQEISACATFQVRAHHSIYNVEITDGCMFVKDLLHRWGSASREFVGPMPQVIPPEAKGALDFGIFFHREQPCHFSAVYMAGPEIVYDVPLKNVTYKSYHHGKYMDITGEYFDGSIIEIKRRTYTWIIQQAVKQYEKTNKLYALKMKIPDEHTSMQYDKFINSKIDTGMWSVGAKFKYDITSNSCSMINANSIVELHKENAQFFVDQDNIKIVINLSFTAGDNHFMFYAAEKYGSLIAHNAEQCGIHKVTKN